MNCPLCNREMEPGSAAVTSTPLGFVLVGLSWKHLQFTSGRTGARELVVHNSRPREARRCPQCGTVVLLPIRDTWPAAQSES